MRLILGLMLAVLLPCFPVQAQAPDWQGLKAAVNDLGAVNCANNTLKCVTLNVPRDHFGNNADETIPVTFAVSFASVESKGLLIYSVGGPGASGLAVADDYLSAFGPELTENMDVVFFDQRGTGPETGLACPVAQGIFDRSALPLDKPDESVAVVQTYVDRCIAELGPDADLLRVMGTDQAIRDVEAFRKALQVPKIWLYGESYGTQFAQEYARAFPEHVSGVVLDGVVDLTLDYEAFNRTYSEASESILLRVFDACDALPACAADMGAPAVQVYDKLMAELSKAPIPVDFPMADGTTAKRQVTTDSLETNAFFALYGPAGRAEFLRVLAAAGRGNYAPMLRLEYSNLYIDPETETGVPDDGWFGAAYFAVTCLDYGDGPTDPKDILAEGRARAETHPRMNRSYYSERMVCALWPNRGRPERPAPFKGGDFPTLVLNGDADPITPVPMSYAVFDHVQFGSMVIMRNGPHVIWGRGFLCPDKIVSDLMFGHSLPETQVQICSQDLLDPYQPLTLTHAEQAADPETVARAIETEMRSYPEFYNWNRGDILTVGCDYGGSFTTQVAELGAEYNFKQCSFWPGMKVSGVGAAIEPPEDPGAVTYAVQIFGSHEGDITYHSNNATEAFSIRGTYDGVSFETPRPMP